MPEQQKAFPKIRVIKVLRCFSNYGLKDCKEIVDDLQFAAGETGYELTEHNCYRPLGAYIQGGLKGILRTALSTESDSRLLVAFALGRLRRYPSET